MPSKPRSFAQIMVVAKNGLSKRPTVTEKSLSGRSADFVLQESAVEPDAVFAEVAALPLVGEAEGLVFGNGRIVLARGQADAGGEALLQVDLRAEPGADAEALAVLVDIELRREIGAGDIERRAGVDGIEDREGAGVVVGIREKSPS